MRRVRAGELVAGGAGLVLLAAMFLNWYSIRGRDDSLTAWSAFSVVDILLAVVALLGIALAVSEVVGRGPSLPVALAVITTTLALAGTLLLAYRIVNQPGPNDVVEVEAGAWLGFVAAIVIASGGWRSMHIEPVAGAPLPPIEDLPAPAP
jgi:heme A synthase